MAEFDEEFHGNRGAGILFVAKTTGRILLNLRSEDVNEPGTWGIFGGAIESGEDPWKAAYRECKEEIGIKAPVVYNELLYLFRHPSGFKYYNFLALVEEEFRPRLNWESDKAKWFQVNQLPRPLHPGVQELLKKKRTVLLGLVNSLGK